MRTASGASAFRSHGGSMTVAMQESAGLPDMKVSVRQVFGIDSDLEVPAYSKADEHVP
ncbi:MAG: cobaltochelatase subunit CobS, partial [Pseudolabrys sp.]